MKLKGALTILNKRAEFYGKSLDWVINFIDTHPLAETCKVIEAHDVYKREGLGLVWSGLVWFCMVWSGRMV